MGGDFLDKLYLNYFFVVALFTNMIKLCHNLYNFALCSRSCILCTFILLHFTRKAVWIRLVAIVSPLLAELVAFCDYNSNLDLLQNATGHWKHQLWLGVLANSQLSVIHYKDFLSPTHQALREKARVKMFGCGDRPMVGQVPFSWLLKKHLTVLHAQAKELQGIVNI